MWEINTLIRVFCMKKKMGLIEDKNKDEVQRPTHVGTLKITSH